MKYGVRVLLIVLVQQLQSTGYGKSRIFNLLHSLSDPIYLAAIVRVREEGCCIVHHNQHQQPYSNYHYHTEKYSRFNITLRIKLRVCSEKYDFHSF